MNQKLLGLGGKNYVNLSLKVVWDLETSRLLI